MALNIKNPEVDRLAEEASRLAGVSKTESIRRALEEQVARLRQRIGGQDREAAVLQYLEAEVWPAVPKRERGRRLARREKDLILGYGKEGV